jgi:clan AA aspartic protease
VISGTVVARQGPVVPLVLQDAGGREHAFSAVVDTGFNGWLTLPKEIIVALGVSYEEQTRAVLADGSPAVFDSYYVTVIWDGQPERILVDELDSEPLIGMRLLNGFRFVMEAIDGGPVQIERM